MKSLVIVLMLLRPSSDQTTMRHKDKTLGEKTIPSWPNIAQLPDQDGMPTLLQNQYGDTILTVEDWEAYRPHIKDMLAHNQYGRMPEKIDGFVVEETDKKKQKTGHAVNIILYYTTKVNLWPFV